ncbi:MAG: TolB family protein [Bellilinea sp.]
MKASVPLKIALWLVILSGLFTAAACQPGLPVGGEPTPDAFATVYAQLTSEAQAATPLPHSPEPTQTPLPTSTEAISPVEPTPAHLYSGFIVLREGRFTALDFNGNPLGFEADISGIEGVGSYNTTVFRNGLAYSRFEDGTVTVITPSGRRTLDFIRSENPISARISPDGSQIAWSYQFWGENAPSSELWIANLDGSNARKVDEIGEEENRERWLILHPHRWLPDGRLLYATQPTGIGGYILYGDWNGMRLYDPARDSITVLVSDEERLGLSLSSISNDLSMAAINGAGIRVRRLGSSVEVLLPPTAGLTICGDGEFSPSDEWLAYACGRNNPDDEAGQALLAPVDGSLTPQILFNDPANAPHVLGWMDENTILIQTYSRFEYAGEIWSVQRDGTRLTRLSEGIFIGFVP